eukprot:TRINITY_DN3297_c0_g1_i12.p2 TRINITY_DN3297_c0_g1~~TRINITY_DN3297_c0_g1_i12.p2  ORF type:complete len:333 (-),score=53.42 TRINITY_DN3297_c0_g1_i12:3344-4342(-)
MSTRIRAKMQLNFHQSILSALSWDQSQHSPHRLSLIREFLMKNDMQKNIILKDARDIFKKVDTRKSFGTVAISLAGFEPPSSVIRIVVQQVGVISNVHLQVSTTDSSFTIKLPNSRGPIRASRDSSGFILLGGFEENQLSQTPSPAALRWTLDDAFGCITDIASRLILKQSEDAKDMIQTSIAIAKLFLILHAASGYSFNDDWERARAHTLPADSRMMQLYICKMIISLRPALRQVVEAKLVETFEDEPHLLAVVQQEMVFCRTVGTKAPQFIARSASAPRGRPAHPPGAAKSMHQRPLTARSGAGPSSSLFKETVLISMRSHQNQQLLQAA